MSRLSTPSRISQDKPTENRVLDGRARKIERVVDGPLLNRIPVNALTRNVQNRTRETLVVYPFKGHQREVGMTHQCETYNCSELLDMVAIPSFQFKEAVYSLMQ
jgi:hypothetical protein